MEKSADADILHEMTCFGAQRLMKLELGDRTGAGHGGKSRDPLVQRSRLRDRDWEAPAIPTGMNDETVVGSPHSTSLKAQPPAALMRSCPGATKAPPVAREAWSASANTAPAPRPCRPK